MTDRPNRLRRSGAEAPNERFRESSLPAFRSEPDPPVHAMHVYETTEGLVAAIGAFVADGLRHEERVVVIASAERRRAVTSAFTDFDLQLAVQSAWLVFFDADELLAQFFVDDRIDRDRFDLAIRALLEPWRSLPRAVPAPRIRAYGEMVDLLWKRGAIDAAMELEALWSRAIDEHGLNLLCAYSAHHFRDVARADGYEGICRAHTHVTGEAGG